MNEILALFEALHEAGVQGGARRPVCRGFAAGEQRVLAIGMDTEQIVGASLERVDAIVGSAASPAECARPEAERVASLTRGRGPRAAWLARAFPAAVTRWLPELLARGERKTRARSKKPARSAAGRTRPKQRWRRRTESWRSLADEPRSRSEKRTHKGQPRRGAAAVRLASRRAHGGRRARGRSRGRSRRRSADVDAAYEKLRATEAELANEKTARIDERANLEATVRQRQVDADAVALTLKETVEALHASRDRKLVQEAMRAGIDKLRREVTP